VHILIAAVLLLIVFLPGLPIPSPSKTSNT